jgi:hypothetical protein
MMGSWHEKPVEQPTMAEQNWACYTSTAVHESDESSTATPRRASLHRPISSVKDGRRVISLSLSLAPPRPPAPRMTPLFFVDLGHQEGKKGRQALRLGGSSVVVNVRLRPLFAAISFPVVAALILDLQSSCLESDVEPKGGDVQLAICFGWLWFLHYYNIWAGNHWTAYHVLAQQEFKVNFVIRKMKIETSCIDWAFWFIRKCII